MIYCKSCKIPVTNPEATACPKCGGTLSEFGRSIASSPRPTASKAAPGSSASSSSMFTLEGEIRALEAIQEKNTTRSRRLAWLSLAALGLIVFVLSQIYAQAVLSYAVLSNVKVVQDPNVPARIVINFDVVTPGKVAFDRRSGTSRTEKLDAYAEVGRQGFSWAWGSSARTGVDLSVVYREGWLRTSLDRHFKLDHDFGLDE